MKLDKAIEQAINDLRATMAKADGDEQTVLERFVDYIGSEVQGWEDRILEIEQDDE